MRRPLSAGVPGYGLEARAPVGVAPQVLPSTGPAVTPWWGWLALSGAVFAAGVLLVHYAQRHDPAVPGAGGQG